MERPQPPGAGPESTGIEDEQLYLFVSAEHDAPNLNDHAIAGAAPHEREPVGPRRLHKIGHRPDRLHTGGHFGARGDRLDSICHRTDRSN